MDLRWRDLAGSADHSALCAGHGFPAGRGIRIGDRDGQGLMLTENKAGQVIPGFDPQKALADAKSFTIGNVPDGADALLLAELAQSGAPIAYVLSDGQHISDLEQMLGFHAPEIPVLSLPGWDCLPYDR